MRALILVAGAALTLSACGGGGETEANAEANAVDTLAVNNLVIDENALGTANLDMNAATTDANAVANAVEQDMTTNSPDANLANGI